MSAESFTVQRYASAAQFLQEAGPWLLASEAHNNVILAVAQLLATGEHPFHDPIYLATVKAAGEIVGCAMLPPPDHFDMSALPPGAATSLVESLADVHPGVAEVAGPPAPTLEFARAWRQARGGHWEIRHTWTWFELREVIAPRPARGYFRTAEAADWPTLREWAKLYARDVRSSVDVTAFFERRLRTRTLFVWDDDGPVCVVAISGRTPNGARLSAVYTPDRLRNRGYASNAVAAASQLALETGAQFCVLFADNEPPTPARIYQKLGYTQIREHLVVNLGP